MPFMARTVSKWVKCDIKGINSPCDYCAAHVTAIGAHVFAVAQITTINSVHMTILSLRFLYHAFKATPCAVLYSIIHTIYYTARTIRQKTPNINLRHTQPSRAYSTAFVLLSPVTNESQLRQSAPCEERPRGGLRSI